MFTVKKAHISVQWNTNSSYIYLKKVFSIKKDKNTEHVEDEQLVELVDEIDEEIISVIYRL